MPIDQRDFTALFLFAHQDDEFGVFARIEQEVQSGQRVCCAYLTDGAASTNSRRRDEESLSVLKRLGINAKDVVFVGRELGMGDGRLHLKTSLLADWIDRFMREHSTINAVFVPAWEGGHPDHDILHAVVVEQLSEKNDFVKVWQYPLYNGNHCPSLMFRVQSPLLENGPVTEQKIRWTDRLRYVRLCLAYPSQWRTWIGLFPFVCCHYIFRGIQPLQGVSRDRLINPPHARPLYYERRQFLDWPTLHAALQSLKTAQQNLEE